MDKHKDESPSQVLIYKDGAYWVSTSIYFPISKQTFYYINNTGPNGFETPSDAYSYLASNAERIEDGN